MSRVFLSHIEKDFSIMQEISQGLEAAGYHTWYFERDVIAGTSYLIQITHALENCDAVVLIASPNACNSDQVTKEVVGAFERGKLFFPVLINMKPPELKERQPEWRHALGGTAMIVAGEEGLPPAVARIIDGLKARGFQPESGTPAESPAYAGSKESSSTPRYGERKQVTVMCSDLSGYTAMNEKLDPEEVKEIMDKIFGQISRVVIKYEGYTENFAGDTVMAVFGVPRTHEDDPVRAIRAAREIHHLVKETGSSLGETIGRPLCMHTGINTGLVVSKEIDFEKGAPGVLGYTIDVASRIAGLAETDEIIVSLETYHQAEGFFNFEKLDPVKTGGAEKPLHVFKVSSPRDSLSRTHRLSGLRAELIGRRVEMDQLKKTVENLRQGKSCTVSIIGDEGTGKSRLVEEFRNLLDPGTFQWVEGHSYAYSQNIPYFPLVNLLSRAWQIREGDPPDQIRLKVETGVLATLGERKDLVPYIGGLYSLAYPELEQVSPEQWKARLHEAINLILAGLCRRGPTIICIEDLHWADPSSVELLRNTLTDLKYPAVFLCLYRPGFNLLSSHQADGMKSYHEIRLKHLSPTDARDMVESLLKTGSIPDQLQLFIRDKAEGNPFYLEEVINSLIETDTLVKDGDSWKLTRALTEKDIPSTVQGVISARLDRLERETRRVLQEASVIGRTFLYEILKRISDLKEYIDKSLMTLEHLDLIKTRSIQPELEYIFKHALTQEVVYNGLMMKERRLIHEKIGLVMEGLLYEHLPEFYETLAYHYSQSDNFGKACEYLKLSGDKASKNYANNEAIRFYKEAIRILDARPERLENKKEKLELFIRMTAPLVFLTYPEGSLEIFQNAEKLARELGDKETLLHIYVYLSTYHTATGKPSQSLEYIEKYFNSAEELRDFKLVAQSAVQVCAAYWFTGDVARIVDIGGRALRLIEEHHLEKDYFGMGYSPYSFISTFYGGSLGYRGRFKEAIDVLDRGFMNACEVNDKWMMGFTQMMHGVILFWAGYGEDVITHAREAVKIFEETEISMGLDVAWQAIDTGYYLCGDYEKAIDAGERSVAFARESKMPFNIAWGNFMLAMSLKSRGDLRRARECADQALTISKECNAKSCEGMSLILRGCMADEMDQAVIEEAECRIRSGIAILEELNLKALIAVGYLHFGEFLAGAGRKDEAAENLKKAETLYLEMEVTPQSYWLKHTKDAIAGLG